MYNGEEENMRLSGIRISRFYTRQDKDMRIKWIPTPRAFELDMRAIGLFRIALGLVVLADQLVRLLDWSALHGSGGFSSRELAREWEGAWVWSVYWLSDSPLLPILIDIVRVPVTVMLILGIRSRTMALVLFVIVSSVINYNLLPIQGGDRVLTVMLFFSVFLPLGARFSLESMWHGPDERRSFRSMGSAAYAVQVLLVFFVSGILKTHPSWTTDFTAISMAIHLEVFATETARLWRHLDFATQALTFVVIWIEWLAPVIALLPGLWARSIGVGALLILEIGIWFSLEVGLFPFISVVSLLPLVPGAWIDVVTKRWRARGSQWTMFYDESCQFCLFACRVLKAVCGLPKARIVSAQSDLGAAAILEESWAWSVRKEGEQQYTRGWEAVRRLLKESGREWVATMLPSGAKGRGLVPLDRRAAKLLRYRRKNDLRGRIQT